MSFVNLYQQFERSSFRGGLPLHHPLKLCLVTAENAHLIIDYEHFILSAVKGGVTSVQLRNKTRGLVEFAALARHFLTLLRPVNIPLIINDHVELAKEIDADGVHLGQTDMTPAEARGLLGPDKLIGWSVETLEELQRANQLDCLNYIAASAVFKSQSKEDCKTLWGLSGLRQIIRSSRHPVVAIGGIDKTNAKVVIAQGACGIAVIGALHGHPCPDQAAQGLIREINQGMCNV